MGLSLLSTVLLALALAANTLLAVWTYKTCNRFAVSHSGNIGTKYGLKRAALCLKVFVVIFTVLMISWIPFLKSLPTK